MDVVFNRMGFINIFSTVPSFMHAPIGIHLVHLPFLFIYYFGSSLILVHETRLVIGEVKSFTIPQMPQSKCSYTNIVMKSETRLIAF